MPFRVHKVVSALPGTLQADAIYAVRTGAGFDLYITDVTGATAHKVNAVQQIHVGTTAPTDTTLLWLDTN